MRPAISAIEITGSIDAAARRPNSSTGEGCDLPVSNKINLVFQGGGVRGVAYAGAIECLPKDIEIHNVGGCSAGAIFAALLAIGKRPSISSVLRVEDLAEFLAPSEIALRKTIELAAGEVRDLLRNAGETRTTIQKLSVATKAFNVWRRHNDALSIYLPRIVRQKGFHSTGNIQRWLRGHFGNKTFSDIELHDLCIVATDISSRKYKVFSKTRTPNDHIVDAVVASAAIPLFFQPVLVNQTRLVDGGVVSNFPDWLFGEDPIPTVGFRLKDIGARSFDETEDSWDYLLGLLRTMMDAHDNWREDNREISKLNLHLSEIKIRDGISSTRFDITAGDFEELLEAGRSAMNQVRWPMVFSSSAASSPTQSAAPHTATTKTFQQAEDLFEAYTRESVRPERISEQWTYTVTIEEDWSTSYEQEGTIEVTGSRPLIVGRFACSASNLAAPSDCVYQELTGAPARDLLSIPTIDKPGHRGWIVFFDPPVSDGQIKRRFYNRFVVKHEFINSLAQGIGDEIGHDQRQRADEHRFKLKMCLRIHRKLPKLTAVPRGYLQFEGPETVEGQFRVLRIRWEGSIFADTQLTVGLKNLT